MVCSQALYHNGFANVPMVTPSLGIKLNENEIKNTFIAKTRAILY